jgi:hypothetical protein
MNIAAVTSFTLSGYLEYGSRFVRTFRDFWPKEIPLIVYIEGEWDTQPYEPTVRFRRLEDCCPTLFDFKMRYQHVPQDWLHHAACKYAFKLHVVDHVTRHCCPYDKVFWLDADTVTHAKIPFSFIDQQLPSGFYTSGLFRPKTYTECSFVGYNVQHRYHEEFMERCLYYYKSGEIFALDEWHDCWVYDAVRKRMELDLKIRSYDIGCGQAGHVHPFINSPLAQYMDHLKGKRKSKPRSPKRELFTPRSEPYWQD